MAGITLTAATPIVARHRTSMLRMASAFPRWLVGRLNKNLSSAEKFIDDMRYFRGRASRYMSVKGGMRLVTRRILGNLSARRCGATLGIDFAGTSVVRWEMLFTASLIAELRHWLIVFEYSQHKEGLFFEFEMAKSNR